MKQFDRSEGGVISSSSTLAVFVEMAERDYYTILQLTRSASNTDIKKALVSIYYIHRAYYYIITIHIYISDDF